MQTRPSTRCQGVQLIPENLELKIELYSELAALLEIGTELFVIWVSGQKPTRIMPQPRQSTS